MLVLTRKQNDKIQIGDQITITVLRMKGKAVRLGIEAPSDVNVMRGELVFELAEEKMASQKETTATDVEKLPPSRCPSDRESRRHGLEIGKIDADRWPLDKPGTQVESKALPGLPSAPLAEMVSTRAH